MGKAVRAGALLLLITTLVWSTTLWRWQTTGRVLRPEDVLLNLVGVPLAATATLLLAVWAAGRLRNYAAQPMSAAPAKRPPAAGEAEKGAAAERRLALAVIAASAQARGGNDWSGLLKASSQSTPTLDHELRDEQGMRVFSARIEEAAPGEVKPEFEAAHAELAALRAEGPAELQLSPAVWRALALLRSAVEALVPTLAAQCALADRAEPQPQAPGAATSHSLPVARRRDVQVWLGVPGHWPEPVRAVLAHWMSQRLALQASIEHEVGTRPTSIPAAEVHVLAVSSAEEFWQLAERQWLQWHRDDAAGLMLAMAADSLLGPAELARLGSEGGLFSGQHVAGHIPGEAAAGLLLASSAWAGATGEALKPLAMLHRASLARRDHSADAAGRSSHATAAKVLDDALAASGASPGEVLALACDADHRGSRCAEVFETLQARLPQLDPGTELLRVGVTTGEVGIARLLLIAALAAGKAQEAGGAVALLGLQPSHERFAAVMRPPLAPADTAPALAREPAGPA